MNALLLISVWCVPLLAAAFLGLRHARWLPVLAALPALIAALSVPVGTQLSLPWLLLGVELGLDATGRAFLLFSALLWLAASLYAAGDPADDLADDRGTLRFRVFFLLAMAGNLGLIVAQDMLSFYLGFTLMGLAAYGLIAHGKAQRARRAARRYLAWTLAGEMILFAAMVLLARQQDGELAFSSLHTLEPPVALLLLVGFGIKLALPGLHFWLPQAYAVAPPAAVAVLSGAMIKAGLLGWLRFVPAGDDTFTVFGLALLATGGAGILLGAVGGLLQRYPRRVLGYSSIGKMGVLTAGMGSALTWPEAAPVIVTALILFAAHHALVKGALFLGLGLVERHGLHNWHLTGLGFLAVVLAGAPFTSGALAKNLLSASQPGDEQLLYRLLAVSALATTLLMARFLVLVFRRHRPHSVSAPASTSPLPSSVWVGLLIGIAAFPFVLGAADQLQVDVLPLLTGVALVALGMWMGRRLAGRLPRPSWPRRLIRRVSIPMPCRRPELPALSHARRAQGNSSEFPKAPIQGDVDAWPVSGGLLLALSGLLFVSLMLAD